MSAAPVAASERFDAVDVLRGFALLGILGANITLFDVDSIDLVASSFDDLEVGAAGAPFMAFLLVGVLNKMMAVFSMLFGAGVLLVTERIEDRGGSAMGIHYRRNVLLLGIGLLHGWLWFGDILVVYALCALILYPIRRLGPSVLVGAAAAVWVVVFFVEQGAEEEYLGRALAMMLLGMALYRTSVILGGCSPAFYRRWMLAGIGIGWTVAAAAALLFDDDDTMSMVNNAGVPFAAVGYVSLVMWVCTTGRLPRVRARLAAAGRMALTNYLMQTVLGMAVIEALNEVRGERVDAFWMMVAMFAIWSVQLAWSVPWTRRFRFGPAEWAWRCATYGRIQPFRA